MKSPDKIAIERQIKSNRYFHEMFDEMQTGEPIDELLRDLDIIGNYVASSNVSKFQAMRAMCRQIGADRFRLLGRYISDSSEAPWRVEIRERLDIERPDGGIKARKSRLSNQVAEIGNLYYRLKLTIGLSDDETMEKINKILQLNLSQSTIKKKLVEFRKQVRSRGYFDVYAPMIAEGDSKVDEPVIKVADVVKIGRPRKVG